MNGAITPILLSLVLNKVIIFFYILSVVYSSSLGSLNQERDMTSNSACNIDYFRKVREMQQLFLLALSCLPTAMRLYNCAE